MEKIGTWGTEEVKTAQPEQPQAPQESGASFVKIGSYGDRTATPSPYEKFSKKITETADLDSAMSASQGNLEWALATAKGISPDEAADVRRLSDYMQLPKDTTQRNLPQVKDMARSREILQTLTERDAEGKPKYPKTLAWLGNPEAMRVAKDDVETLTKLEKELKESNSGAIDQVYRSFMSGLNQVNTSLFQTPALVMGAANYPFNKAASALGLGEPFKVPDAVVNNPLAKYYKQNAEAYAPEQMSKSIFDQAAKGDYEGAAKSAALQVVSQIPNLAVLALTGGAASAAGASAATAEAVSLGSAGLQEASSSFSEKVSQGKGQASAFENAVLRGTAEGVFEKYTLDILKGFGKQATETLGKDGAKEIIKRTSQELFKNFIKEGKSEAYTSIAQDLADVLTGDKVELSDMGKNAINSWVVGGLTGAGMTGASVVPVEMARRANYEAEQNRMKKALEIAEQSKLRERSPELFEDAIKQNVGDGKIYVPAEAVLQLQQNDPEGGDAWAKLFNVEDQLKEATATGRDLEIDKAAWIARSPDSDFAKKLMSEIRYDLNGYSEREAQAKGKLVEHINEMQKDYAAAQEDQLAPEQVQAMREKLMTPKEEGGFGLKSEDADAQLSVLMAGAQVLSKKRGESAKDWFNRVNPALEVGGTYQPGALSQMSTSIDGKFTEIEQTEFEMPSEVKVAKLEDVQVPDKVFTNTLAVKSFIPKTDSVITNSHTGKQIKLTEVSLRHVIDGAMKRHDSGIGGKQSKQVAKDIIGAAMNIGTLLENAVFSATDTRAGVKRDVYFAPYEANGKSYLSRIAVDNKKGQVIDLAVVESKGASTTSVAPDGLNLNIADFTQRVNNARESNTFFQSAWHGSPHDFDQFKLNAIGTGEGSHNFVIFDDSLVQVKNKFFQGENNPRGSVSFENTRTLINLFETANLSTFLHETSHILFKDMQALVESGQADEQTVKDFESLKEFVGGDITTVEAQEKLARAFEIYLREGKAPSVKLQSAFGKFRAWLTAIYKTVKELGKIKIQPEISAVFDRMLASEKEIEEARVYYQGKKSLGDILLTEADEAARKEYENKEKAAKASSLDNQVKKYMRAYFQGIGGRKELYNLAKAEIEAKQVYRAITRLKEDGGLYDYDVEQIAGGQALEQIKAKYPEIFFNPEAPKKKKKVKDFYGLAIEYGGIEPKSLAAFGDHKWVTENGLLRAIRKDGRPIDLLAQEWAALNLITSDDPQEAIDLIKNRKPVPGEEIIDEAQGDKPASLSDIAIELDYFDPALMIEEIIKEPTKSDAIKKRTDELVAEKEAEIRSELSKQENIPGEESLHDDASMAFLIAESELIRNKLTAEKKEESGIKRIEARIYKDAAKEAIDRKNLGQAVRYDLYAKAEQKYANESYELAKKGDLLGAHEAKKKQILNHAMVQAAIKARQEKEAIEKRYQTKNLKTKLNGVENDYMKVALDIIQSFGLNTAESFDKVGASEGVAHLKELDEVLFGMMPDWVINKQVQGDYKSLSLGMVRELDASIQSIIHYGRSELKAIEAGSIKRIEDFVQASANKMATLSDKAVNEEGSAKRFISDKIDGFTAQIVQMEFLSETLDGFSFEKDKVFGPMRKAFKSGVKCEDAYQALKAKTLKEAEGHWKDLYSAKKRLEKTFKGKYFEFPYLPVSEDMKREGRYRWTAERLIAIMLNTGNAGNLEALQMSYGFTDAHIAQVAKLFTTEELKAIQGIWDVTDSLFPQLDTVHKNIYNRNLDKVESRPASYVSSNGDTVEFKGGYYPLQFDHALNDQAAKNQAEKDAKDADIMKNRQNAVFRKTKPEDGMTHSRTGSRLPPALSLDVWFGHIGDTARYISYAEYMRDMNRITLNKDWRASVKKKVGKDAYNAIRDWVTYLAAPERMTPKNYFDRFLDHQRKMGSMNILGLNMRSSIKQLMGIYNAATDIGWSNILSSVKDLHAKTAFENSDEWQKILKISPYLRARSHNIDREMADTLNRMAPGQNRFEIAGQSFTWKDVQDFNFEFMAMADRVTIGICWKAAFNKYMQENLSLEMEERIKDAVEKADSIVSSTQPSSLPLDTNQLQKAEGAIRIFISFMTGTMKYGNRVMLKYKAYKEGAISGRDFYRHVMNETLLFGWTDALITSALVGGGLPDWWEWITSPINTLLGWIPFFRDASGLLSFNKSAGKTPAVEGIDRSVKAAKSTYKAAFERGEWDTALWDIGRAAEFQIGVPALRLVQDVKHNYELATGQLEKKKK